MEAEIGFDLRPVSRLAVTSEGISIVGGTYPEQTIRAGRAPS